MQGASVLAPDATGLYSPGGLPGAARGNENLNRAILIAALILSAAMAAAVPATASRCVPAEDEGARKLPTPAGTLYVRLYPNQGYMVEETWQENNGETGLQYSDGMTCVGYPDRLILSRCIGFCPLPI